MYAVQFIPFHVKVSPYASFDPFDADQIACRII